MKKIFAIALVLCLLFAIVACKGNEEDPIETKDTAESEVSDTTPDTESDTDTDTEETEETDEILEGGMKVEEDKPEYGAAQYPDAE